MSFKYSVSVKQQKKLFLFGYYNRPVFWFQRRFGGPFLFLTAALLALISADSSTLIMSGFFALYGLFYIMRPYLLLKRCRFSDYTGEIIFSDENVEIKTDSGTLHLKRDNIIKIIEIIINTYLYTK